MGVIKKVVEKIKVDIKAYIGTIPDPSQFGEVIDYDADIYCGGKLVLCYRLLGKSLTAPIRYVSTRAKMTKNVRTNGIQTQQAVFGYLPRVPYRNDYCRSTKISLDEKLNSEIVAKFTNKITKIYKDLLPDEHNKHIKLTNTEILPEWRFKGTPFSTCSINTNHAIKYHIDAWNTKGVFSNVLILKDGISGGYLVCPEYGVSLSQRDGALCIFDWQSILHGVSPIKQTKPNGYRSSIVFYALSTMKHCYPFQGEIEAAKSREEKRLLKRLLPKGLRAEVLKGLVINANKWLKGKGYGCI